MKLIYLKTVLTITAEQSTKQPTSPSLPQVQNTSSLIITPPTTFELIHSNRDSVRKARETYCFYKHREHPLTIRSL